MLVNLTPIKEKQQRRRDIAKKNNFEYLKQDDKKLIQEIGVYQCSFDHNFSEDEFEETKEMNYDQRYNIFPKYDKASYGVADSIEQIKEYFKEEVEDVNKKYCISLTPVFQHKENKGTYGGWRWYKWGEYIGELDSKCEYLDDEDFGDDFKYVICFQIYLL